MSKCLKDKLTICIKTFERPHSLRRCLESVRKYYPHYPVIVVDDGKKYPAAYLASKYNALYVNTLYNIGIAQGRNFGIEQAQTKYVFICDDDNVFTAETKLEALHEIIEKQNYDILGCEYLYKGVRPLRRIGFMVEFDNAVYIFPYTIHDPPDEAHCIRYDIIESCFISTKLFLMTHPYDARLKLHPEREWFWRLKKSGARVYYYPGVSISHFHTETPEYKAVRYPKSIEYECQCAAIMGVQKTIRIKSGKYIASLKARMGAEYPF